MIAGRACRAPGCRSPLRNTATDAGVAVLPVALSCICVPAGVNQAMSPTLALPPWPAAPLKKRRRRNTGWSRRSAHDPLGERRAAAPGLVGRPVDPGQLVVLAVGVVVAALGAAHLVAVQDHRHALRQQQRGEEVALLAGAQREDRRVVGLALDAAVPRPVVALAVAVALAVGLVVLVVVRDQVAQREAVVRGDEVDARDGAAAVVLVEVARAGEAGGELAERSPARRARSRGRCRGTCRSTRSTAAGSCRPGSRPRRRPTARR